MPYKRSVRTVKSAFMTGKLLNLNKPTLGGGGKKSKALLGCGVWKVGCSKCLEISKSPLSYWLTALTPFWLVLLLTLCHCLKLSLVHFSRSLNTCWLTHMVYEALRGIKSNKSGEPDPIPGKVWKKCAFQLSPVITNIYNASMVQGYVPVFLKQSEVVPVPKCSPPKVVEQDLRPISLTPHIAKVMEGLTLDSLFKQVCDKLDTHQFALARKSTTHALVYFLQVIREALDQGDTYARIFFTDFSKGFDLVDHNILIQEMELLGVHEATIRWIGSFLTDRSQRVRIGQVYSHPVTPNGGIPQGTKLAPLLFAILVNNLCRDWRYRIKYVDDTSVFFNLFLNVRLATFHLSPQILTPTLPCVTCGLMRKNVKIWLSIF